MHHLPARFALLALFVLLLFAASLAVGVGRAAAFGFAPHADYATGAAPYAIAVGDFNGDGNIDLVTADFSANTVSILLGNSSGGFGAKTDFATSAGPDSVAVGDFNGDGNLDLVTANFSASTIGILLGNGSGGFAAASDFATGVNPASVAVGDFNGDGNLDLAAANWWASTASILLGDGSGGFGAKTDRPTGDTPTAIAVGDFNGDGAQDLAVSNRWADTASVLLGSGSGKFATKVDFATGGGPASIAVGDFNADGQQDLATANAGPHTVSILLGNGSGGFAAKTDFATGWTPVSIAVGDFNGDGKQDLATADSGASTASVLIGNGSGGFAAATSFATGLSPFSIATGDFNADGWQDLATANHGADSAGVLLNRTISGTMTVEGGAAATGHTQVRVDSAVFGATELRLRDQGGVWGAWQPYAAQVFYWILSAGDGAKTIEAQYRSAFDQSPIFSDSIVLDTTAPATTDDAPAGWQTVSPVTVTLSPIDGGSGMSGGSAKTQYKLDGAAGWTNDTSVKVGDDGAHTIAYRSIDAVGNVEETQSCTVRIDATAPTTTVRGVTDAWLAWPQTVFLTANDGSGSGMSGGRAQIEYDLDGAGWTTGDWIVVMTDGDHTLQVRATDAAGNVEKPQKVHVLVDRSAPVTTDNTDGLPHRVFSVVLTPSDALSGVAATSYRIDGGAWRSGASVTLRIAIRHKRGGYSRGAHLVEYRSTDNAGNLEEIERCTVTLGG